MPENLMTKDHKATSDAYREGYDRIEWGTSKAVYDEDGRMVIDELGFPNFESLTTSETKVICDYMYNLVSKSTRPLREADL